MNSFNFNQLKTSTLNQSLQNLEDTTKVIADPKAGGQEQNEILSLGVAITTVVLISLIYIYLLINIKNNRDKPLILRRSPRLMIVICIGAWLNSVIIVFLMAFPDQNFSEKCQIAIFNRIVPHYILLVYILVRIYIAHKVNKLRDEIKQNTEQIASSQIDNYQPKEVAGGVSVPLPSTK